MGKLPAFQFYPGDWMKDTELRLCSIFARGLLVDLLCLMFEAKHRGTLSKADGVTPLTDEQVVDAVGGGSREQKLEGLSELLENGVLKRNEQGIIYSARLLRDEQVRKARAESGSKGGSKKVANRVANGLAKPVANSTPSSSSSSSSSVTIYTAGPDVFIPKSIDTPEVAAAVGSWMRHLDTACPEKSIVPNSPQEEALWRLLADWRVPHSVLVSRVNECIANGWVNLRPPESKRSGGTTEPSQWPEVVRAVSKLNMAMPYTEILTKQFGPDVAAAVKKIGVRNIAEANEYTLSQLQKQFAAEVNA